MRETRYANPRKALDSTTVKPHVVRDCGKAQEWWIDLSGRQRSTQLTYVEGRGWVRT